MGNLFIWRTDFVGTTNHISRLELAINLQYFLKEDAITTAKGSHCVRYQHR